MIILDTSFIYSFLNKKEKYHNEALKLMNEIFSKKFGQPVIFEYVFDELLTLMTNKQPFNYVKEVIDLILKNIKDNTFMLITLDDRETSLYSIIKLFKKINDDSHRSYKLSFTDCAILFTMLRHDIKYLASFDSGFDGILNKLENGIYELSQSKRNDLEKILREE